MKRAVIFLLLLSLVLSACAKPARSEGQAHFYYRVAEADYAGDNRLMDWEPRDISEFGTNLSAVLRLYLDGPTGEKLLSPFPKNLTLEQLLWYGSTLRLTLSANFAAMTGVDLSIACACIAQTCAEVANAEAVQFWVEDEEEGFRELLTMKPGDLMLHDNSLEQLRRNVTLYYTDSNRRFLIPQTASVEQDTPEKICMEMINLLLHEQGKAVSPLPLGTRVLGVSISRNVCTVNLSDSFEENRFAASTAQRITLLAITNTLTQLDEVEAVEFAVNGERRFHYGAISTSEPFVAEEAAIGPVRLSMNENDLSIYMVGISGPGLLPIPMAVRNTTGSNLAEQAMETLLNAAPGNGYQNPIPAGTTVEDIYMENGCCYVTLGGSILTQDYDVAQTAVRAIAATLCDLSSIDAVQIHPVSSYQTDLSPLFDQQLQPVSDWYAQ